MEGQFGHARTMRSTLCRAELTHLASTAGLSAEPSSGAPTISQAQRMSAMRAVIAAWLRIGQCLVWAVCDEMVLAIASAPVTTPF